MNGFIDIAKMCFGNAVGQHLGGTRVVFKEKELADLSRARTPEAIAGFVDQRGDACLIEVASIGSAALQIPEHITRNAQWAIDHHVRKRFMPANVIVNFCPY